MVPELDTRWLFHVKSSCNASKAKANGRTKIRFYAFHVKLPRPMAEPKFDFMLFHVKFSCNASKAKANGRTKIRFHAFHVKSSCKAAKANGRTKI